jgi:hypothetical protein
MRVQERIVVERARANNPSAPPRTWLRSSGPALVSAPFNVESNFDRLPGSGETVVPPGQRDSLFCSADASGANLPPRSGRAPARANHQASVLGR